MFNPEVILSMLDEIERRTEDKPILTVDINCNDPARRKAFHYLTDGEFLEIDEEKVCLIHGLGKSAEKLRYDIQKDIQHRNSNKCLGCMTLLILVLTAIGVFVGVLTYLSVCKV